MCLRDARFKIFKDSILGIITASMYDGPVYFNCYLDLTLALDDPNIVKALTLNIASSSYHMEEGSKPFALIYHIYYRLLGTKINECAKIPREPSSKTMLIQYSTPDAKIQVPKMIQWQDVKLPNDWLLEQESPRTKPIFDELDLTHIQQYLDGTVKISFQNNPPLRINEGRHSFAGSESISKRDQEINDFLKKNLEKPSDLKLKVFQVINLKLALFTILLNLKLPLHLVEMLMKKKMTLNLMTLNLFVHLILIFLLLTILFTKIN